MDTTACPRSRPRTRRCLAALLVLGLVGETAAQTPLHSFQGPGFFDEFGKAAKGAGDVNGDGFDDLIVGAPRSDLACEDCGSVIVFSGRDGSVLWTVEGATTRDFLGRSVDGFADLNGDGFADVLVGTTGDDAGGQDLGSARVLSGADGSTLQVVHGDVAGPGAGMAIAGIGDATGDGVPDYVVSAGSDVAGSPRGQITVVSGQSGSVHFTAVGDDDGDGFGRVVAAAGDVDGDGFADVIAGAPFDDDAGSNSGSARVWSGADGSVLVTLYGGSEEEKFGSSVSGAGDVDADGFDDVIVGVNRQQVATGSTAGRAVVYSGADWSVLYEFVGSSEFEGLGRVVSAAGDVDADGHADLFIAGAHDFLTQAPRGRARIVSGRTGGVITQFPEDEPLTTSSNTFELDVAGDVNGDGLLDHLIGERCINCPSGSAERVIVYSGATSGSTRYCSPNAPSSSAGYGARIEASGSVRASDNALELSARLLPSNTFGYFLVSRFQGHVPQAGGSLGTLCLGGNVGRYSAPGQVLNSGSERMFALDLDLPNTPGPIGSFAITAGLSMNFQAWFRQGTSSNFTDAITVHFR